MISSVRGTVLTSSGASVVIEVGGIGLAVTVTPAHAASLHAGATATVRTALIVREDDLSLYGFADTDELAVFDLLRGVTGVGPKSAMAVLAAMTASDVATAVATENDSAFRKVSGIGPKTAKLIVLSLTGKIAITAPSPARTAVAAPATAADDVVVALVGLGWQERVAGIAVADALGDDPDLAAATVPVLLRASLARLGPQGARS
ncbi:Holliday junction branch migration protein RuvA [Marisediminicola sp. LYQ134]|uniref:Holliday junction branch migration protein RuvA n=1 Tax=unclassified Marisediminicola TaxID=2618316 RepID=UPI0039836CAF